MERAPFQVLVLPYHLNSSAVLEYAIFPHSDELCWRGISGGGEDEGTQLEAARWECLEEKGIPGNCLYLGLETINSIPVIHFQARETWGKEVSVIPEYIFGDEIVDHQIQSSPEHREFRWLAYADAFERLTYEGNRTALWELNCRLRKC